MKLRICELVINAYIITKDKNYQTYISSGSNDVLYDCQGQECIILDYLRSNCLGFIRFI
ncbi:conserved hypothetical protein [Aster yellows witches'-broom phytoplasma AYWB]|uniref:Uncharacterized protein n=1 Tax=Aster yellows witches'-broom phytoplasma (strain AYWB) TaxID=322098 RepID=Q2NJ73_AYWBP|nr:conserved hypothetical protein [Aster yellows witches'-broom phytoplasma AYWB]